MLLQHQDTIVAAATPSGGAIAIVRIEGPQALDVADRLFRADNHTPLAEAQGYKLLHGLVVDSEGKRVDDILLAPFRAPHSYTGGNMVELYCHGSALIVNEIVRLAIENGARAATAGEFTKRAFMAGKIDLSQAEAVADIIAADSKAALRMADTQLRGEYSQRLQTLRQELIRLASLLELELDFGEEDVEFANRPELLALLQHIADEVDQLKSSFSVGNAIKKGISVAIVGKPNVGKSTLLNRLVGDDRAMVSDIAGTTRDTIEECITLGGVQFRFIDTAGVHHSDDRLENMGIERTLKAVGEAQIIICMFDDSDQNDVVEASEGQTVLRVKNKCDLAHTTLPEGWIAISAKEGTGIELLKEKIAQSVDVSLVNNGEVVVSNSRHYEALHSASEALTRARSGLLGGISTDLVAQDIRQVLDSIGSITGEITSTDLLHSIFSKFCIGK